MSNPYNIYGAVYNVGRTRTNFVFPKNISFRLRRIDNDVKFIETKTQNEQIHGDESLVEEPQMNSQVIQKV